MQATHADGLGIGATDQKPAPANSAAPAVSSGFGPDHALSQVNCRNCFKDMLAETRAISWFALMSAKSSRVTARNLQGALHWIDRPPASGGLPAFVPTGAAADPHDRPQSVPPAMLGNRLATWPDTGYSNGFAPALSAAHAAWPFADDLAGPRLASPFAAESGGGGSNPAASAAVDDPIKQVQMRFRARAQPVPQLPPVPPLPKQQFASLSFPVHASYEGPGQQQQQQQQQPATPRFQSISQDSVVGQYRQHVRLIHQSCYTSQALMTVLVQGHRAGLQRRSIYEPLAKYHSAMLC